MDTHFRRCESCGLGVVERPHAKYCDPCGGSKAGRKKKWKPNERIDAVIVDGYNRMLLHERGAIKNAAARIGWPKFAALRRGADLGLARTKEKPWSEPEIAVLQRWGWMSPERIRLKIKAICGVSRSAGGVLEKQKRMRLTGRNLNGYSMSQLMEAFGVDHHVIRRWVNLGILKGIRRGTERLPQQGGDIWWFSQGAVKRFVFRHPQEVDLRRVEKFWFLDLVTDGKICK